jgi:hypothetical protein
MGLLPLTSNEPLQMLRITRAFDGDMRKGVSDLPEIIGAQRQLCRADAFLQDGAA